MDVTDDQIIAIGKVLQDPKRPLKERFRALFTLKNIGGKTAIACIKDTFSDSSALLKHEVAYCLGQMQDENANFILTEILEDQTQEAIVRHEAAEALGAIGSKETLEILKKYINDPVREVRETCELALNRINSLDNKKDVLSKNPYNSVDPALPHIITDVKELKIILLDESETLSNRYRAMFSLRNMRTKESLLALCEGLKHGGALFKHEIAFVLGQMQEEASVPFLIETLKDLEENEMVRHECAEALGAIATEECTEILKKYLEDEKQVVRESCEIALDMCEYENSPEFQYANCLKV